MTTSPTTLTDEELATSRMYAAHVSLRTPEVANADSVTNREILQTMVLKAINGTPATPAPRSGATP